MNTPIFLNLAFGGPYIEQQIRCNASIRNVYPDAHIKSWTNEYPPGSKTHRESLYGFKPHAVQWALDQGYSKIVWLDTACVLNRSCEDWWFKIPNYGVLAAKDDNLLINHISDKYVNELLKGIPFPFEEWHLVGGSLYVFDFKLKECRDIFEGWKCDEQDGYFGSQVEQSTGKINKHRHDESSMAVNLYSFGNGAIPCDELSYNTGNNPIISKYHFK